MNINEFISTSRELKKTFEDSKLSHRWIKYFVSNGFYLENQFLGKCCSCNTQIFIKEAIKVVHPLLLGKLVEYFSPDSNISLGE